MTTSNSLPLSLACQCPCSLRRLLVRLLLRHLRVSIDLHVGLEDVLWVRLMGRVERPLGNEEEHGEEEAQLQRLHEQGGSVDGVAQSAVVCISAISPKLSETTSLLIAFEHSPDFYNKV